MSGVCIKPVALDQSKWLELESRNIILCWLKNGLSLPPFGISFAFLLKESNELGFFIFIFKLILMLFFLMFPAEAEAVNQMRSYVDASRPVILYIDKLFISRELGIDW
ncbi:hypothetical protein SLEP1_g40719 [Rubroshorea leprosula]|uniref:Uncharacterized protein n=1 Tax=Rubroshorea leprosula TaxID=152421 RepID=A0AAV5L4G1_9ROSI|nr:hypothetical protein SLEP1_g40719 [Rubroshorea leprosula]